ncbi:MAG TPA: hypothetical protein VIK78_14420 [Ruminiclostridium sp.]
MCNAVNCINNDDGECTLACITVDDDGKCEDIEGN